MGLIIPKFGMAAPVNPFPATPAPTLSTGPNFNTATPGINVKTAWSQLVASTTADVWAMSVIPTDAFATGALSHALLDIGVGAAASEQVVVSNMIVGGTASANAGQNVYWLPVWIPKGSRIAARMQSDPTKTIMRVTIVYYPGSSWTPWPTYTGVDCIGADTATSFGLSLTAGNAGTESAWTNVGSVTTRQYKALKLVAQLDTNAALNSLAYHAEIGIASTTLAEYWFSTSNQETLGNIFPFVPQPAMIPTGTQLMVRAECSGTGEALQYGILAFY